MCKALGGQDLYIDFDGALLITVQNSHSIPRGAYWECLDATTAELDGVSPCPATDPLYNCTPPSGFFNFKALDALVGSEGRVRACLNQYSANVKNLYAVTPHFNRTDCVELTGLGIHNYTGPNPPVWAYY